MLLESVEFTFPVLYIVVFFINNGLLTDHFSTLGELKRRQCFFDRAVVWVQSAYHHSLRVATQRVLQQMSQFRSSKVNV